MDFSNHPLNNQSTVDSRLSNKLNQSTIDYTHHKLSVLLKDDNLGKGLVATALKRLGEAEVLSIANYAVRKGTHPGRLFVAICNKALQAR